MSAIGGRRPVGPRAKIKRGVQYCDSCGAAIDESLPHYQLKLTVWELNKATPRTERWFCRQHKPNI